MFEKFKDMRKYYVIGPYQLGSKKGKSWVVGIPSDVAKAFQISASTLFALTVQKDSKSITLQQVNEVIEKYNNTISSCDKNLIMIPGNERQQSANVQ